MDDGFKARADARRRRLSMGGLVDSHEELAARDDDFWRQVAPEERIGAVRILLEDLRRLRNDEPFRRLQGSPGGLRSLEG
ncbi:MAG: hypothetical protein AAF715_11960 [Myxococcota bacterium]